MKYNALIVLLAFFSCTSKIEFPRGGYDYPKAVRPDDTILFAYQFMDSISKKDSLTTAYFDHFIYDSFDEPNLSIKPVGEIVFRFEYWAIMDNPVFITLTENKIIAKKRLKGWYQPYIDTHKLSDIENFHYDLLQRFRLRFKNHTQKPSRYLDSLLEIYPELADDSYYKSLLEKGLNFGEEKFQYTTKVTAISRDTYAYLVNLINSSGYWNLPFMTDRCAGEVMDGYGFRLEANTPFKYNLVIKSGCPNDTSKFTRACQELINHAGLGKELNIIWVNKPANDTTADNKIEINETLPGPSHSETAR